MGVLMGKVSMDTKQLKIYRLSCDVLSGKLTIKDFSKLIGKSYRQAQRIINRIDTEDFLGVFHKNMGKTPHNKTPEIVEAQIKDWLEFKYNGFNLVHFREMVVKNEAHFKDQKKRDELMESRKKNMMSEKYCF
jgi:hypothetical protein